MKGLKQKICSEVFKEKIGYTEYVQLKGVLDEIDAVIGKVALMAEESINDNQDYACESLLQVLALLNGEKQKEKQS